MQMHSFGFAIVCMMKHRRRTSTIDAIGQLANGTSLLSFARNSTTTEVERPNSCELAVDEGQNSEQVFSPIRWSLNLLVLLICIFIPTCMYLCQKDIVVVWILGGRYRLVVRGAELAVHRCADGSRCIISSRLESTTVEFRTMVHPGAWGHDWGITWCHCVV